MIEITQQPIDSNAVLKSVASATCGANVLFVGTTRQFTRGVETERLEYEAYQEMAVKELAALIEKAKRNWEIESASIVHRIGPVPIGEASVAVAVGSPHREAAFAAAAWLIETLKQNVPIWKREHWVGTKPEWIHPDSAIKVNKS